MYIYIYICTYIYIYIYEPQAQRRRREANVQDLAHAIHRRGVQWKQGVVIYMMLHTNLLYNTTPIHCTPLSLHPPVMNTQQLRRRKPRRVRRWARRSERGRSSPLALHIRYVLLCVCMLLCVCIIIIFTIITTIIIILYIYIYIYM